MRKLLPLILGALLLACATEKNPPGLLSRPVSAQVFFHAVEHRFLGRDAKPIIHTISKKENFWTVARERGIDVDTIMGSNPFLKSIYAYPDQRILLPDKKGVLHLVHKGENLSSISRIYGKKPVEIRTNNRGRIRPGSVLFIPGAKPKVFTPELHKYYSLRSRFIVPIHGWIGAHYGWRQIHPIHKTRKFHKGIDLGAPLNSPIFASASGTVRHAGWSEGYGYLVILDHEDRFETWYGHCSRLYVRNGQQVKQGQIIARMGNTGASVVPHLHFEVRTNGVPMNPMKVLW